MTFLETILSLSTELDMPFIQVIKVQLPLVKYEFFSVKHTFSFGHLVEQKQLSI